MKKGAKIFIVGPAGSGKTKFAELLSAAMGAERGSQAVSPTPEAPYWRPRAAECGDLLVRWIANMQANGPWPDPAGADAWVKYIRKRKEEYRGMLRALGDQLAIAAPAWMLSECADNASIVVGARRRAEAIAYYGACIAGESATDLAGQTARERGDIWIEIERGDPAPGDSFDREWFRRFCTKHVINLGEIGPFTHEAEILAAEIASL